MIMASRPDVTELTALDTFPQRKNETPLNKEQRQRQLFGPQMYDLLAQSTKRDCQILLPRIKASLESVPFHPRELPSQGLSMRELSLHPSIPLDAWIDLVSSDYLWNENGAIGKKIDDTKK